MYQAFVKKFGKFNMEEEILDNMEIEYDSEGNPNAVILNNQKFTVSVVGAQGLRQAVIFVEGMPFEVELLREVDLQVESLGFNKRRTGEHKIITAPMPGHVIRIDINNGDSVVKGNQLLTLEAMKMENTVHAHIDGLVKKIFVAQGQTVSKGDPLLEIE